LVPAVVSAVKIPVIAAGGIATGKQMLSSMVLGASAVQIGSRFAASIEASCHQNFKDTIINLSEGDTALSLKKLTPVRLIKNKFFQQVNEAENAGAGKEDLQQLLGRGRAKKGMFEGDLEEGELEIGQVSSLIQSIEPAGKIVKEIWSECQSTAALMSDYFK
jgi:enoyl-[acyl-carrier protein] reductase II